MSKKLNSSFGKASVASPKNNLFNYFSKSPATLEKKKIPKTPSIDQEEKQQNRQEKENLENLQNVKKSPEEDIKKKKVEEKSKPKYESDDEEEIGQKPKKRRRLVLLDSDNEDEQPKKSKSKNDSDYQPSGDEEMPSEDEEEGDTEVDSSPEIKKNHVSVLYGIIFKYSNDFYIFFLFQNNNNEPKSKKAKLDSALTTGSFMEKLQQLQSSSESKTSKKQEAKCEEVTTTNLDEPVVWPHQKLEFMKPDKIKDKKGRRPDHPDYDPSTLYVPQQFLDSLSPVSYYVF